MNFIGIKKQYNSPKNMFSFLKNHPFAVEAFFESSTVLTFAVPKEQLQILLPECLTLDTFQDKWAFVAVAMVQTKNLRPKDFPKIVGNDFFLIGYRIFVRYTNEAGKNLRGLYILKSETDKKKMEYLGNVFTHYNYTTTDISQTKIGDFKTIKSQKSDFKIVIENTNEIVSLPQNSPFADWAAARRFAGPLRFTFTYDAETKKVLIIEGVRENWTPKPIKIIEQNISFLATLNLQNAVLANAFEITNIPYFWKKGKIEQWKK
jgi:uncharacterized protein YqjF (DUF2071 family)